MRLGFLGRQGLRGNADLPADRLGDQPERYALGNGVERLIPGTPFKRAAEDARGIQPVHGWPEVLSVTDIGGNALFAGCGGKHGNETMAFPDAVGRARKANHGCPQPALGERERRLLRRAWKRRNDG